MVPCGGLQAIFSSSLRDFAGYYAQEVTLLYKSMVAELKEFRIFEHEVERIFGYAYVEVNSVKSGMVG